MSKVSALIDKWEKTSFKEPSVPKDARGIRPLPSMQIGKTSATTKSYEPSAPPMDFLEEAPAPELQTPARMVEYRRAESVTTRPRLAPSSAPAASRKHVDQRYFTPKQQAMKPQANHFSEDVDQARKLLKGSASVSPTRKRLVKSEAQPSFKPFASEEHHRVSKVPFNQSFDEPVRRIGARSTINETLNGTRATVSPSKGNYQVGEDENVDEVEIENRQPNGTEVTKRPSKSRFFRPVRRKGEEETAAQPQDDENHPQEAARYNLVAPRSKRKCRDIICLLTLLVTWVGMCTIGIIAVKIGNVNALLYATDFQGRVCGTCRANMDEPDDSATCGKPFQIVDPNRISEVFAICAEECPKANETICPDQTDSEVHSQCWQTFVDQRPLFYRCIPLAQENRSCSKSPYLEFVNTSLPSSAEDPLCGTCLDPLFEPDGVRPKDPSAPDCKAKQVEYTTNRMYEKLHPAIQLFSSWGEIVAHWLADLQGSWQAIAIGGGCGALIGSLAWILLFACFARTVVWLTLFSVVLGSAFLSFELLYAGGVVSKAQVRGALDDLEFINDPEALASVQIFIVSDSAQMETYAIAGWILTIVTILLFLLACSLQKNVIRAASVLRGASRAVLFNCSLWLVPVFSFGIVLGIFAWWMLGLVLLSSAGRVAPASFVLSLTGENVTNSTQGNEWVDVNPAMIFFHTFGCLWTIFFVRAIAAMTISAVVASWRYKERQKLSVCAAVRIMLRFHFGTAAFGSAIIAMLQLLRMVLSYLDRKTRTATLGKPSALTRAVLALSKCILMCFSAFLKFATRFSYVIVAIRGESFCVATKTAFVLLSSNLVDTGVSLFFASVVLFLGRLVIVGLSAACTWALIWQNIVVVDGLSSYVAPVLSSTILAWFVTGACFDLYAASLDTLIICKLEQKVRNLSKRSEMSQTQDVSQV